MPSHPRKLDSDPGTTPAPPAASSDDAARSLYAKHEKIYPREVHGWFATMRVSAGGALLGLFYGVCWLRWDGRQLLLFDLPARTFHVFGLTFFPQDFVYLTVLLIIAALSLFLFTAFAGRLWCGYACPQTVYTELFLWIERKIEGDRQRQMKLDQAPWSARKLGIKSTKHAIWIAISLWTGFTFVGYFTPIVELGQRFLTLDVGGWALFWVLFYGFATYGNAGWLREQVCMYMCPYARFQSAMFDRDTLVISYDPARGEPRGSRRRGIDPREAGLGDCVNCTLCVQVCPTGIDIRDGLQYQCIACAACIDVCNQVMDRMGYPPGLIRYTTESTMAGSRSRLLRPRLVIYAAVLLVLVGALVAHIVTRVPLELDVLRDRNALFRPTPDGRVENVYTLKIVNMDRAAHTYTVTASGIPGLTWSADEPTVTVGANAVASYPLRVQAAPEALHDLSTAIEITVTAIDDASLQATEDARFLGWRPQ